MNGKPKICLSNEMQNKKIIGHIVSLSQKGYQMKGKKKKGPFTNKNDC
jgi:hypothetical protein